MKDWSSRQLRSLLDAHGVQYQRPYPGLKDRHYAKYLRNVCRRAFGRKPSRDRLAIGYAECKMPQYADFVNYHVSIVCPVCMSRYCECEKKGMST